jgi:hypothetical protein
MQKIIILKNPLKETKILWLISSFDTSQNIIFQKSSYRKGLVFFETQKGQINQGMHESKVH